jgi:hypothetical protein
MHAVAVDVDERVAAQPVDLDRATEDRVQQDELVVLGLIREQWPRRS